MSGRAFPRSQGAVGRADLLRTLAAAPCDRLTLDSVGDGWFGYVQQVAHPKRADPPVAQMVIARPSAAPAVEAPPPPPNRLPPLQMPWAWAVLEEERHPAPDPTPQAQRRPPPLSAEETQPPSPHRLVNYQDLTPMARVTPALRRFLGASRCGGVDAPRLVEAFALLRPPQRLPRLRLRRWPEPLVAALDFSPALWPLRHDMHRLARRLTQLCGRSDLSLRLFNHGPHGGWRDWRAYLTKGWVDPPLHLWTPPPPGAAVLIIGDLGLSAGPESPEALSWRAFVTALRRRRTPLLGLAPISAAQLPAAVTQPPPILRWSPDARAHPVAGRGDGASPDGLADLLAMAAVARRVDPPLLRALRQLNPVAPNDAGLEVALWRHEDVNAGYAANIKADRQEPHLARFRALPEELQRRVRDVVRDHHAHWPAVVTHEECLLWAAHCPAATKEESEQAEAFFDRLASTLTAPEDRAVAPGDWAGVAHALLHRADPAMRQRYRDTLGSVVAAVGQVKGSASLPDWVDPALLAAAGPITTPTLVRLVHDVAAGSLRVQTDPPGPRQRALGAPLPVDGGGLRLRRGDHTRWLAVADLPFALAPGAEPLRFDSSAGRMTVGRLLRPRGAGAWRCGPEGVTLESPPLAGVTARWDAAALARLQHPDFPADEVVWADAPTYPVGRKVAQVQFGIDRQFGLFADTHLQTEHGEATQRFRWIEPGIFLMGSPRDEAERDEDEGPQHWVTLTEGFWLADSACTQAVWEAVMGNNPSDFKDPERPVDSVSWDDAQRFLQRLEELVPGCGAALPTEAQWEYACRAGTVTPFSFGATITPDQVNYHGDYPYGGALKGLFRRQTVAVKSLSPNPWGLYEMHGNLWEWCADGRRDYGAAPVSDPLGPTEGGASRALRGGSWIINARFARSAYRDADRPGVVYLTRGFRVLLRSSQAGGETSDKTSPRRPGGPSGEQSGGRSPQTHRDDAAPTEPKTKGLLWGIWSKLRGE